MKNYFEDLYEDVYSYTYESLAPSYNPLDFYDETICFFTESKKLSKKEIIFRITLLIVIIKGLITFSIMIKNKYKRMLSEAEKRGYEKGKKKGYKIGKKHGSSAAYQYATREIENEKKKSFDSGVKLGKRSTGYNQGLKEGIRLRRDIENGSYHGDPHINKYNNVVRHTTDMAIDYYGTEYDKSDSIKTVDSLLDTLANHREQLKFIKAKTKDDEKKKNELISKDDDLIDIARSYKEVFDISKDVKGIGKQLVPIGSKYHVKMPDTLKKKLDEL